MRDYGRKPTWVDYKGRIWPVVASTRRLKFKYPSHAALREHVFVRDDFQCCRCDARATNIPAGWNGRETLLTNTKISSGYSDMLIVDHIVTLKAGGLNVINNFQTLCETCNKSKQREDIAAARAYKTRSK